MLRRKPRFPPTPRTFCQDFEAGERVKGSKELLRYYQNDTKEEKSDEKNEGNGME